MDEYRNYNENENQEHLSDAPENNDYQYNGYGQNYGYPQNGDYPFNNGFPQNGGYPPPNGGYYGNYGYPYGRQPVPESAKIGFALAALIISLVNFFLFASVLSFIAVPLSLIFAIVSLSKHRGGKAMSIIAIVVSCISAVIFSFYVVIVVKIAKEVIYYDNNRDAIIDEYKETGKPPAHYDKYRSSKYNWVWRASEYYDFDDFFDAFMRSEIEEQEEKEEKRSNSKRNSEKTTKSKSKSNAEEIEDDIVYD